jgi:hypothetical protein
MNNIERHHIVPLSCGGHDIPENIYNITYVDHKHIHDTLNINYSNIRTYRKRTNHILFATKSSVQDLITLQKLYFARIHLLKPDMIKIHRVSIERQFIKLTREHSIKMNVEDYRQKSEIAKFHYFLYLYHETLITIVSYYHESE